ncbi:MAG: hypothetical protein IPM84_22505 [Anaerolineae bacterium]|nr:hypothetical protein [Anaerolineae bacterium]
MAPHPAAGQQHRSLTLNVTPNLEPGNYPVRITGASGAVSYHTDLRLNVVQRLCWRRRHCCRRPTAGNSGVLATLLAGPGFGASAYRCRSSTIHSSPGAPLWIRR